MTLKVVESHRCFGGTQSVYEHDSNQTRCPMKFGLFMPEGEAPGAALIYLSGLTCTEQNFITKGFAQRFAAEHNLAIVAPDTSPRGLNLPGEGEAADFGTGAGFYLDATQAPWDQNYRMFSYVTEEVPALLQAEFSLTRLSVFGHSMGGHGALVCGLRLPDRFVSVSAFSPISAPSQVPWGQKALSGYLGADASSWADYDATALIGARGYERDLLVDVGTDDPFLAEQLGIDAFESACKAKGVSLELRRQPGYDHGYYFISTFMEDHIAFHAQRLRQP